MRYFAVLPKLFSQTFFEVPVVKWVTGVLVVAFEFLFPTEFIGNVAATVITFLALDWITGIAASLKEGHRLSSIKAGQGAMKVCGYFLQCVLVSVAANAFPNADSAKEVGMGILLAHIAWTELVSITENFDRMGSPLPPGVKRWLRELKKARTDRKSPPKD